MFSRSLALGIAVLLMNTTAADDKRQIYVHPDRAFAVDIPAGWSIVAQDANPGFMHLTHATGGVLALYFEESTSGKWTVDSLTEVVETVIRQEATVGEPRKSLDLTAGVYLPACVKPPIRSESHVGVDRLTSACPDGSGLSRAASDERG